jgi:cell division inhibitor SepF
VRPLRFDQAQEVADTFKHGQPVIMNVQEVDRDLLRRLIDFASGLCYALNGKLDKVATGVYLLTPANVSDEDRRQMAERDFD